MKKPHDAYNIDRQIERFRTEKYRDLEEEMANNRIDWFRRNKKPAEGAATPRDAYEMLIFEHIGKGPDDNPVLSETDEEIVWSSIGPCDTLEACRQAGFDTRDVCRAVYEKSTQALISQLDSELRFYRSYEEIRPHSHHCKEKIMRMDFEHFMGMAVEEANFSLAEGNKGYGCVVVFDDQVIGRAHDTQVVMKDPSLHAVVNAIRQAAKNKQDMNLSGAVLFTTCEPCPMCASLAVWANLTTIVFGLSVEELYLLGRQSIIPIPSRKIVEESSTWMEILGGVLADQCKPLYS